MVFKGSRSGFTGQSVSQYPGNEEEEPDFDILTR
jgi:hypothetical protein